MIAYGKKDPARKETTIYNKTVNAKIKKLAPSQKRRTGNVRNEAVEH